ncbi:tryptophan--tRNA ligase [Parendozoicomonas sp. Alg238-R29]|uniref:tryptophan--tRNA ligase n=1 Tax=Parendozoicomonas sp. Alg238-R29 TaxID=2993446 RepID=UPI00248DCC52|nr:tryptophan--tRNA ligase [Parendozoicomonas sp. Alg238-R29]
MSMISKQAKTLTGIKPTGTPHLGNYVGAIRPAIEESRRDDIKSYYFLADYHTIIGVWDPELLQDSTRQVAATWLALGLDTDRSTFYRQSDIPEIPELCWMLNCMAAKGLMNRAHAYKASMDANVAEGNDPDKGVTMGLFSYPVLMAADILMFNANRVPVGRDQVQHIEMARDIASRFNHIYKGEHFVMPEAVVGENSAVLSGLDGRKMSKSYGNVIPLFCPEKKFRKYIMKVVTNSLEPGEPKDPENCSLFQIFSAFAKDETEIAAKRKQYEDGAGWGVLKQELFEYLNEELKGPREEYDRLIADPAFIEAELKKGASKAREESVPFLQQLREAVGFRSLA